MSRYALFLLAPFALTACPEVEVACDLMAVSSVVVDLTAEVDLSDQDIEVSFTTGDGQFIDEPCDAIGDGRYACGYEIAGELTITASGRGWESASSTVDVQEDICHVITEELTLQLLPVDCTAEAVASVLLEVVDEEGVPIPDATATWSSLDGDTDAQDCVSHAEGLVCGYEVAGQIELEASAPGYASETYEVTVEEDECHVITESVSLTLAAETP